MALCTASLRHELEVAVFLFAVVLYTRALCAQLPYSLKHQQMQERLTCLFNGHCIQRSL